MRKRPSKDGIYEIRKIPSNCSVCGKLMYGGICLYEIESEYLACEDCFESSKGPEKGAYMVIEEYDRETEFKFFRGEQSVDEYNKRLYR